MIAGTNRHKPTFDYSTFCNNWIVNIENTAAAIESQLGSAVIESVFKRYGARGTWDLIPSVLSEVFSELYAIEADLD